MVAAEQTHVSAIIRIPERRKRVMWDAPTGLLAMQSLPEYVGPFLSNCFKDWSLFEK